MALVVLLRGVNVGGHRAFRPATLARQLTHFDAVNLGANGTLVIRRRVSEAKVRAELARIIPCDTTVVICQGRDILRLMSHNPFHDQHVRPEIVRFVSVLSRLPIGSGPSLPMTLPSSRPWLVNLLARDKRYIFGVYRRHMKVISCLGKLDRVFGVPVTTRNWNTVTAIANVLGGGDAPLRVSRR